MGPGSLNGSWELAPSVSEDWRFRKLHQQEVQQVGAFARTRWIPARVPGSVHEDLQRAGTIEDPYSGLNSLNCEWVSSRQWVYCTRFEVKPLRSRKRWLCFDGIDHSSEIHLDGELLGTTEGQWTPHRFEVTHLNPGEHLLVVVLKEPPAEQGQLGRTSETRTLKGRFGYGWDFGTRLIHTGIWKDVFLVDTAETPFWHGWATSTVQDGAATLMVQWDAQIPARVTVTTPSRKILQAQGVGQATLHLPDPQLWWPHELGPQNLHSIQIDDGVQQLEFTHGIRTVTLEHNSESKARGALPYTLTVNGVQIEMRGFNGVSADHLLARSGIRDTERTLMHLARHANANLLRFNGVCPVPSKTTLDTCDQLGLMVWQEMPLSSSSTDNIPPTSEAFLQSLQQDLPPIIRHLRNHPSVVLYDAGNELTDEKRNPVSLQNPTVQRIQDMIQGLDPTRPFLPTSPSGPSYDLQEGEADQHDVHGPWHYRGLQDTYRPFYHSRSLLHSEFGCQATPRLETLRTFLPEAYLWPMNDSNEHVVHHGSWWLMGHRIEEVFGPIEDLETYVRLTQFVQHEVLRYGVLSNRVRPECSGSLVWQLNEPWPNAHCTNVVDFTLKQKAAFYGLKDAFEPEVVFLKYLTPHVPDGVLRAQVLASPQTPEGTRVQLQTFDLQGSPLQTVSALIGGEVELAVPGVVHARMTFEGSAGTRSSDLYFTSLADHPLRPLLHLPHTALEVEVQADQITLNNRGSVTAHFVTLEAEGGVVEFMSDGVFTLLPGEERTIKAHFLTREGQPVNPECLTARGFNGSVQQVAHA